VPGRSRQVREYWTRTYRVRRNSNPVRGAYRCDLGYWIPYHPHWSRVSRDRFNVIRTVKVGTKAQCEAAAKEAEVRPK
jgi:hypothetical protein